MNASQSASPAIARANNVFPAPGRPWRRTPRGGSAPKAWYPVG
eukprot:CAMPEP_0113443974 /NCGR_PEP_ID=MMETSP0014_2-20120614/2426_1 /TAXON_ID=2857 /ORGANISM="Nitzschia sp." /LENGTH=42 /DNA_ID=CAMNT_0000334969 /DNA_START=26 /DNA_END=150 /DNA_ORIENTATION=- /assembly_acc=CAM_ASM_000159